MLVSISHHGVVWVAACARCGCRRGGEEEEEEEEAEAEEKEEEESGPGAAVDRVWVLDSGRFSLMYVNSWAVMLG